MRCRSISSFTALLGLSLLCYAPFSAPVNAAVSNTAVNSMDFVIYNVYRSLNMGGPGDAPEKDYYINAGLNQGVHAGAVLEIYRKISTYNQISEQHYRDILVPIAWVKVIHVDSKSAVARLDHMLPSDQRASVTPSTVMVGDIVKMP